MSEPAVGKVYLVGAGPGDPGLITLRGAECLRRAEVVLYDYLVNPCLLAHAAPGCERICLGQHRVGQLGLGQQGRSRLWSQDEINARLVELARAGRTVVRLKGGDPAVFGRGVEEMETLVANGIPFEVVPGITAALAAGSYAGIPITHREFASAVALVTGQEDEGKDGSALDFAALANFPGTLVIYMGVTTVRSWSAALVEHGKSPDTPVAIVRRCSHADQHTYDCTLGTVADFVAARHVRPPVVFIVGDVARLGPRLSWFDRRPLFGQSVLVTRPADQAGTLAEQLSELGAEVLLQPAIEIGPPRDWTPVDAALRQIERFDWLVFSSANGVRILLDRLSAVGRDVRALGPVRLAAIGPGTADELARYHLRADLVPPVFRAESLAESLAPHAPGQRFLLARASRGREVLAEQLLAAGGAVEQVVVYSSTDVAAADPEIVERLRGGAVDWVTVSSSAIARSLVTLFGETLRSTRLASISPITSETLRSFGFEPAVEAREHTLPGLVAAMRHGER